eukprot:m51a1_g4152 hypothetical protein (341) ;mRNA; f:248752-249774
MFVDLNIPYPWSKTGTPAPPYDVAAAALRAGWDAVAFNLELDESDLQSSGARLAQHLESGRADAERVLSRVPGLRDLSTLRTAAPRRVLWRVTVSLADSELPAEQRVKDVAGKLRAALGQRALGCVDVLAAACASEGLFRAACASPESPFSVVVCCPRPSDSVWRLPFDCVRKALRRGCALEVSCSRAVTTTSPAARAAFVTACLEVARVSRAGRSVVVTSGARSPAAVRAPMDLANLAGALAGFAWDAAVRCVSANPLAAVAEHARSCAPGPVVAVSSLRAAAASSAAATPEEARTPQEGKRGKRKQKSPAAGGAQEAGQAAAEAPPAKKHKTAASQNE